MFTTWWKWLTCPTSPSKTPSHEILSSKYRVAKDMDCWSEEGEESSSTFSNGPGNKSHSTAIYSLHHMSRIQNAADRRVRLELQRRPLILGYPRTLKIVGQKRGQILSTLANSRFQKQTKS
jgi:hypothetical protein